MQPLTASHTAKPLKALGMKWACLAFVMGAVLCTPPVQAAAVAVAFSPGTGELTAENLVLDTIQGARRSIRLAAYSFTSTSIANALIDAKRRGIDVKLVMDESNQAAKYGPSFFRNAGIPIRVSIRYAIMHNKFMVVDGVTVQTGSFNYTNAASDKNAENVIVVRDSSALAKNYESEWSRLWRESNHWEATAKR